MDIDRDQVLESVTELVKQHRAMDRLMRDYSAEIVENERLRDAIRFALEAIDGDDVIGASEHLRAAGQALKTALPKPTKGAEG